ncbi:MAG: potassium channel family protein [Actinomycetia bacterium]|nr:potassium channel family protein [Actinomycetes bacterium]
MSRIDARYFTVTTLATVGYGDITPTSGVTRSVTMVEMVLGVTLLGAGIRILLDMAQLIAG